MLPRRCGVDRSLGGSGGTLATASELEPAAERGMAVESEQRAHGGGDEERLPSRERRSCNKKWPGGPRTTRLISLDIGYTSVVSCTDEQLLHGICMVYSRRGPAPDARTAGASADHRPGTARQGAPAGSGSWRGARAWTRAGGAQLCSPLHGDASPPLIV